MRTWFGRARGKTILDQQILGAALAIGELNLVEIMRSP
jgi:hypothetical protein